MKNQVLWSSNYMLVITYIIQRKIKKKHEKLKQISSIFSNFQIIHPLIQKIHTLILFHFMIILLVNILEHFNVFIPILSASFSHGTICIKMIKPGSLFFGLQ